MKIVGVQLDIAWEDKQANYDRVRALLDGSQVEPDSLIVLPEMFATGFSMNVDGICEDPHGKTEPFLADMARQHRSYLFAGVVTKGPDGRGRNEAICLDPSGKVVARYCKLHPFSFAGETEHYVSGDEVITFPWGGFTVSPFICYDLRFPEVFRASVRLAANLFVVIANWPQAREVHWTALLKARAIENQAYVIGVNRCGSDPKNAYSGQSMILDPRGEVMVAAGDGESVISAELDLQVLQDYRRQFPALADIRDD